MLKIEDRQIVASGSADNSHFWSGNCQGIREELLRQACKSCDYYATDILILLERQSGTMEAFIEAKGSAQIDIYFVQSGCNWELSANGEPLGNVGSVPKQYRAVMILTKDPHAHFSDESVFTLYRLPGNV